MRKPFTLQKFIEKAINVHGDKYDYSSSIYHGSDNKIKIICPEHGEFEQIPYNHLMGKGCKKCSLISTSIKLKNTHNQFIEKAKKIHGDKYDYSLVDYINNRRKVIIICPEHGNFEQIPSSHLLGGSCKSCANNLMSIERRLTKDDFIDRANKIHGDKYDYSLIEYINHAVKVIIVCPIHGKFKQAPNAHLMGNKGKGCGCRLCKESTGERKISIWLNKQNIKFIREYKFDKCKNIKKLPFDFYLPDLNTCIEYDGEQHYKPIKLFGGLDNLKKIKKNDLIKTNYCFNYNIGLIRIRYDENLINKLNTLT
jgi:serine protease inhibitor ecotin